MISWGIMDLQQRIEAIQTRINYRFRNTLFLLEAMIHKSYASHHKIEFHYERLEFLGDAILQAFTSEFLYISSDSDQGTLTQARAGMVSRDMLSQIVRELGIEPFVLTHQNLRDANGKVIGGFLGDFFESILAAVYLDGGEKSAKRFLKKVYGEFEYLEPEKDYKSRLQEMSLKAIKELPVYVTILTHEGYLAEVSVSDETLASGKGRSKKKAEQMAARNAVDVFQFRYGRKEA